MWRGEVGVENGDVVEVATTINLRIQGFRAKVTAHIAMGAATDIKMREMSVEERMIRKLKVSPPQVRPQFSGLFAPLVSAS